MQVAGFLRGHGIEREQMENRIAYDNSRLSDELRKDKACRKLPSGH